MTPPRNSPEPHLWEIRWVRDLLIVAGVVMVFWVLFAARAITIPVLMGFGLAYVFSPFIRWADKHGCRRTVSVSALAMYGFVFVLGVLIWVPAILYIQGQLLVEKLPKYFAWGLERLKNALNGRGLGSSLNDAVEQVSQVDASSVGAVADKAMAVGVGAVGIVGQTLGFFAYLLLATIVIAFCFVFFSLHFDAIVAWFLPLFPKSSRKRVLEIVRKMDRTIAAFVRGRLIQSVVMMVLLSLGWMAAGVPYWLLLGILCGALNLIPYAASLGCAAAVVLTLVDSLTGAEMFAWGVVVWPIVVYAVAQLIDGWVVEPLVQGQATNLDPLTVLLVVMIGGTLFGLLGMLLAIPATACIKILVNDLVLPKWREYADSR